MHEEPVGLPQSAGSLREKILASEGQAPAPGLQLAAAPCIASEETRLRRALTRILSAAEGDPNFPPMNWSEVAEVARRALGRS